MRGRIPVWRFLLAFRIGITMATLAEINAIKTAINNCIAGGGAQEVTIEGKTIRYDLDALRKLLAAYEQSYAASTSGKLPFVMYSTKPKGMNC